MENNLEYAKKAMSVQYKNALNNLTSKSVNFNNAKRSLSIADKIYNRTQIKHKEGLSSSFELSQMKNQSLQSQGKYIPILRVGDIKIINCLPSYDHPGATDQLDYLMSLVDDNTVLAGDMHWEDGNINSLYIKHQLINHMNMKTFTGQHGQRLSLDKILTRGGITIDDIVVHDELATNNIEHYPYEFTIHDK